MPSWQALDDHCEQPAHLRPSESRDEVRYGLHTDFRLMFVEFPASTFVGLQVDLGVAILMGNSEVGLEMMGHQLCT